MPALLCYNLSMPGYYSDTHPEMEALQVKLLRQVPGWRRLELMVSLCSSARDLALAGLRRQYAGSSDSEIQRRLADILLGEDLACKLYGEPPYVK